MSTDNRPRCAWLGTWAGAADPLYRVYHDEEWGRPCTDERALFELLTLEGAQAGLAWITVLRKRENYRRLFLGFDIEHVAAMTDADVEQLMQDAGIIRNRAKITSTIDNARAWLTLREAQGDVVAWLWSFVGGQPHQNRWQSMQQVPARTAESDAMSKALKKAGFRFVGSTICYAFMQATGMVNDHTVDCFCHAEAADTPFKPFTSR
ncbi:MAG: DNA-3-methyladenine glycosylase I [Candidatus Dactylopiibacterium carminicum]|nr:MAG: DNA-3-methyladenine glycosylase I [Candidatus Dactylopiibacterium carminicum]